MLLLLIIFGVGALGKKLGLGPLKNLSWFSILILIPVIWVLIKVIVPIFRYVFGIVGVFVGLDFMIWVASSLGIGGYGYEMITLRLLGII